MPEAYISFWLQLKRNVNVCSYSTTYNLGATKLQLCKVNFTLHSYQNSFSKCKLHLSSNNDFRFLLRILHSHFHCFFCTMELVNNGYFLQYILWIKLSHKYQSRLSPFILRVHKSYGSRPRLLGFRKIKKQRQKTKKSVQTCDYSRRHSSGLSIFLQSIFSFNFRFLMAIHKIKKFFNLDLRNF